MGKIQVLDTKLANMIAAGEVVERPSSVLKELVENSIDAQSENISVYVYEAGRKKIVVEDDGIGMDPNDALQAFKRHATSKLSSTLDLFRIKTLGFRGEALPSIASVSKMEVITSTIDSVGSKLTIEDEEIKRVDAPSRKGTIITVEELFYNTPARLKYLKTDYTENANSLEVMTRIALAHPEVSIRFYIDDKEQFRTTGRGDLLETIASIYGFQVAKNMIPFSYSTNDFQIEGYLGKPELAKSSRYYMITLLNGRNVYMPKVQGAITEAYSDFIAPTRYPFVILNLQVDYSLVDVNVHPSKKEVRFSKEEEMRLALLSEIPMHLRGKALFDFANVQNKVEKEEKKKEVSNEGNNRVGATSVLNDQRESQEVKSEKVEKIDIFSDFEQDKPQVQVVKDIEEKYASKEEKEEVKTQKSEFKQESKLRALAQLKKTYIIAEGNEEDDGFYLIDQHAAMERVNFEYFTKLYSEVLTTMSPLIPKVITLNPSDYMRFNEEKRELLKKIGLSFEPFGYHAFKVVEIPTWIKKEDEDNYVDELIHQAIYEERVDENKLKKHAIATMACKASLKANAKLDLIEMQTIIDRLFTCENPHNCPHGRPIIIKFSKYELEKLFKRTGI